MQDAAALSHETLVRMVRREDELRTSQAVLRKYDAIGDELGSLNQVTDEIQAQVAEEFATTSAEYMKVLMPVRMDHVRRAALGEESGATFLRFDRSRPGSLCVGDLAPE